MGSTGFLAETLYEPTSPPSTTAGFNNIFIMEKYAIDFFLASEADRNLIVYIVLVTGFALGAFFNRTKAELKIGPYFAYSAMLLFATSVIPYLMAFWPSAIINGFSWLIVMATIFIIFVASFVGAGIAKARSRDAFGTGRLAVLAFLPLLNFILLVRPSKKMNSRYQIDTTPVLTGGAGVMLGILFSVFAAVSFGYGQSRLAEMEISFEQEREIIEILRSYEER